MPLLGDKTRMHTVVATFLRPGNAPTSVKYGLEQSPFKGLPIRLSFNRLPIRAESNQRDTAIGSETGWIQGKANAMRPAMNHGKRVFRAGLTVPP